MKVLSNLQKKSKRIPRNVSSTLNTVHRVYYFGSFFVYDAEQQLLHDGVSVHLAPKAFDVLLLLIQHKGRLVTKEKLLKEVWPNVYVEEANLSVNIASLRKALEERDSEQQYIQTVPKRGYRFAARVSEHTSNGRVFNSVAVLPFKNEGCGPAGEYLSTGLMESITNSLSQSRDLRVMARHTVHSRHRCNLDPRAIGHELGVRSVLVGRILQLDQRLIIRTELVDVMNGWQLWGEQYHTQVSDILSVQQELTEKISERLRTTFEL
jgi:DNA-binding winged helix-turn-helix (wHTH) protein